MAWSESRIFQCCNAILLNLKFDICIQDILNTASIINSTSRLLYTSLTAIYSLLTIVVLQRFAGRLRD